MAKMSKRPEADAALSAYRKERRRTGSQGDDREMICDLITDLMHLVDTDRERFDMYDGETVGDNAMRDYLIELNDTE